MKKALLIILAFAIVVGSAFVLTSYYIKWKAENPSTTAQIPLQDGKNENPVQQPVVQPTATTPAQNSLIELQSKLKDEILNYSGDWSIYVKDLKTLDSIDINNKKMISASLIKLFIMAKTYSDINAGKLESTSKITKYLTDMITVSDNQSSNELVTLIGNGDFNMGMKSVNNFATSIMCYDTEQQRDMRDSRPVPIKEQNYTSVKDCAIVLEKLYKKQLISPDADTEMLNLLLKQTRTWKIPSGVPKGVKVANKTGELGNVENDVAIVFSPKTDYILCIISNEVPDTAKAKKSITQLSEIVYKYFNK